MDQREWERLSLKARMVMMALDTVVSGVNELIGAGYVRQLAGGGIERCEPERQRLPARRPPTPELPTAPVLTIDEIWERHQARAARAESPEGGWTPRTDEVATEIPVNWIPNRNGAVLARDLGLVLADEVSDFKSYHQHKGTKRTRWHTSFAWWLLNSAKQRAADETQTSLRLPANADDR